MFYEGKMRPDIKETIDNYVSKGWEPGGFLLSVLANDLMGALGKADQQNRAAIFDITKYIYNDIPSNAWGSYEIVQQWLAAKQEQQDGTEV